MTIKMAVQGICAELLLDGRLDTTTAPETEEIFSDVAERYTEVILNLAKLEYISSAGLRIVKKLHMAMRKKGGLLTLKNVNPMVMEVFEMTGFAGLLNIE